MTICQSRSTPPTMRGEFLALLSEAGSPSSLIGRGGANGLGVPSPSVSPVLSPAGNAPRPPPVPFGGGEIVPPIDAEAVGFPIPFESPSGAMVLPPDTSVDVPLSVTGGESTPRGLELPALGAVTSALAGAPAPAPEPFEPAELPP